MDLSFLVNRYLRNCRIVEGYTYQFLPWGGGASTESYLKDTILRSGSCFLDVGANAGGWSIPAARFYREVHSFEANPRVARVLNKNVRLNGIRNITVHGVGLGEVAEQRDFWIYPRNGQDSFLPDHTRLKTTGERLTVETRPLDSFGFKPTLVKVDTEGFELPVLAGARETIRQYQPVLVVETHDEADPEIIQRMLPAYQWRFRRGEADHPLQTLMIGEHR